MIFDKTAADRICHGRQTRTTRLGAKRWELGGVHGIQRGNYGTIVAHVRIVGLARIRLGNLTEDDARAEGFSSLELLKRHWRKVYGKWERDLEVWDVRFVLCPRPERLYQSNLFTLGGE